MNIRFLQRLAASCALILLSACATTPEPPKEIPPRPARDTVQRFAMTGRAIISQANKANNVRIVWEHSPEEDSIGFASPISGMLAELHRTPLGATWATANGERYEARNADMLIARITDSPVPIAALALWLTGRTTPLASNAQYDATGRLVQAMDNGWVMRVISYETALPNALPSVIEAENGIVRIRLAIEDFQI